MVLKLFAPVKNLSIPPPSVPGKLALAYSKRSRLCVVVPGCSIYAEEERLIMHYPPRPPSNGKNRASNQ